MKRLTILPTGEVLERGVERGKMTVQANHGINTLVVKEAGHKYWTGIGRPHAYAPAQLRTYRIDSIKHEGANLAIEATELIVHEPSSVDSAAVFAGLARRVA